jgi:hypothetical protein
MPGAGHPRSAAMLAAAARLFDEHQHGGVVRLGYDCILHLGEV